MSEARRGIAASAEIYEVGPRDGLQNEARFVATVDKIRLVDALSRVGFRHLEAASFVSARWMPQMADAAAVLAGIRRAPGVVYAALAPNIRGYAAARAAGAGEVAVFAAASDGFSRRNINCTVAESFARFAPILAAAARDGVPVRGYVSCVVACPYDGPVEPSAAAAVAARLFALGCREVSLGDTIGAGTPDSVRALLAAVGRAMPLGAAAGHFHDTRGLALDCVEAALDVGLRVFDAAVAGVGGCPYAPGAAGNVATGRVAALLAAKGFDTGLDAARLADAEALMLDLLGRTLQPR